MEWIFLVAGLFIGSVAFNELQAALAAGLFGYALGQTLVHIKLNRRNRELADKLAEFERRFDYGTEVISTRLTALEQAHACEGETAPPPESSAAPAPAEEPPAVEPVPPAAATMAPPVEEQMSMPEEPAPAFELDLFNLDQAASAPAPEPPHPPVVEPKLPPAVPDIFSRAVGTAHAWLLGGNPVLRVGVVLLFLGLAFLLKYAAERISVSVEMRYVGVAAGALVLLALGWRLRTRQASYGLILQGTGVAVLYLTVFAAMYLHPLLSPPMAFALLVAVTVFSTALAVLQDSLALAAAATLGGLATPLFTSIHNSVPLFSYLLLLNLSLFAIAWKKAWRTLNLIGFIGTFALGLAWGMRFYTPDKMVASEAFLIAFFLLYVTIGLLFARRKLMEAAGGPDDGEPAALLRWAVTQADYVHGTILFGPPIVGFGMQYVVVHTIEFAAAFSALALGLFYLLLATRLRRRIGARAQLLVEVYLALGVIFGTLAIPLGLDARWTSAAWAVEGAGSYWIGLRQRRTLARIFALLLQIGAAFSYLQTLRPAGHTLLDGPWLGALLLGTALLFSYRQLRRTEDEVAERAVAPLLAVGGLGFLHLSPALLFATGGTAAHWALPRLATLLVRPRLRSLSYLGAAAAIQLLGGALFVTHLHLAGAAGTGVLDTGWRGMAFAGVIGFALITGMALAVRDAWIRDNQALIRGASVLLLAGLLLVNVAVLFVLPWRAASGVWGGSGLLILWLGLQMRQRAAFVFGLLLELAGGFAFLRYGRLFAPMAVEPGLRPLAHAGFWTPAIIALVAFAGAWRLLREHRGDKDAFGRVNLQRLSDATVIWGVLWWAYTAYAEIQRFVPALVKPHALVLAAAASVALWTLVARRVQWRTLALLCQGIAPVGALVLLDAWYGRYHPAAHLGALAWPALAAAHLFTLRRLDDLLPERARSAAHVFGAWLLLAVLSLEMRYLLMALSETYNAWRWLGWSLVPSVYLLAMARARRLPWPVAAFGREYRALAALPVAASLLAWVWLAGMFRHRAAQPPPPPPLVNPRPQGTVLALFALYQWLHTQFDAAGLKRPLSPRLREALLGATLFAVITTGVFRACHYWAEVPFALDPMLQSMLVQAALSLVWTTIALALMIGGNRRGRRDLWLSGAILIAVVVVKLFLVELDSHGSIERILSFIGVGILLLVVGYFAPLPPRRTAEALSEIPS